MRWSVSRAIVAGSPGKHHRGILAGKYNPAACAIVLRALLDPKEVIETCITNFFACS